MMYASWSIGLKEQEPNLKIIGCINLASCVNRSRGSISYIVALSAFQNSSINVITLNMGKITGASKYGDKSRL